jgi:hypothetical protein
MRSPFTRLSMTIVMCFALLGTTTPLAHAVTVATVVFEALITLDGPLSYPCVGVNTLDTSLCPIIGNNNPLLVTDLPLPTDIGGVPTNFHLDYGHNKRVLAGLSTVVCIYAVLDFLKADKVPVAANNCSFTTIPKEPVPTAEQNTMSGSCGMVSGQGTYEYVDESSSDPQNQLQSYYLDLHFTSAADKWVIVGHIRKRATSQQGLFIGTAYAVPIPDSIIPFSGNSCLAKTATLWTVTGEGVMALV